MKRSRFAMRQVAGAVQRPLYKPDKSGNEPVVRTH